MSRKKRRVRLAVVTCCVFAYVLFPYAYHLWLRHQVESGALPAGFDSTSVPFDVVLLWLLGILTVVLVVCVLTIWKFVQPQRRS